ncbi:hypothetical protein ACEPAF_1701 [Sanghuangporus sanghuang]
MSLPIEIGEDSRPIGLDINLLLQTSISNATISQYCQIAALVLLVYDLLITFDKEVEHFWAGSFRKPVTILFFVNRYIAILCAIARLICKITFWVQNISACIIIISIDCILTVRVLAFYSHYRTLSMSVVILLVFEVATKVSGTLYGTYVQDVGGISLGRDITACWSNTLSSYMIALAILDWSLPMSFGLILMCLALYKAAQYWEECAGIRGLLLVNVLIRDQAIYFLAMISLCALHIAWYRLLGHATWTELAIIQQVANPVFLSVLGNRMLFNLKEAGKYGFNEGTNYRPKSLSGIEFCEPDVPGTEDVSSTV